MNRKRRRNSRKNCSKALQQTSIRRPIRMLNWLNFLNHFRLTIDSITAMVSTIMILEFHLGTFEKLFPLPSLRHRHRRRFSSILLRPFWAHPRFLSRLHCRSPTHCHNIIRDWPEMVTSGWALFGRTFSIWRILFRPSCRRLRVRCPIWMSSLRFGDEASPGRLMKWTWG